MVFIGGMRIVDENLKTVLAHLYLLASGKRRKGIIKRVRALLFCTKQAEENKSEYCRLGLCAPYPL